MPPQRKNKTNHGKKDKAVPKKPEDKGMKRKPKANITDIYEASDDERALTRKGHELDEVDNYEYHVDHVEEEDDEEIDSDEAFDDSDDERFESFRFQGSTKVTDKKKSKKDAADENDTMLGEQEIDMNEDEDDESADEDEDEDGEGFVDLSEMLSGDEGAEKPAKPARTLTSAAEKLLQGASESEEDEAMSDFMSDDDEEDEADHDAEVVKFIDSLETKKRKRNDAGNGKKKQRKEERTEVYEENEFNLLARGDSLGENKKKLDLNDLMGSMANEDSFASLRKTVLELDGKGKNVAKAALSAPVAKRIQDRADRQMAYQEVNKNITKWEPTVIKNREAEHLSFPLQAPPIEGATSGSLSNKFSAQTALEKQIEEALESAGMKDKELEEFEALQLNKLSVEEVAARRQELQMMRELMFRHELKARRLKKIKSKSYRKLQRKEKEKQELLAAGAGHEIDEDMGPEDQMKAALERAEERMSLKHKNTSKWAKRALARGQMDDGTREAIMDQLRRGEELRKKVQGMGSDGSDNDSDDANGNEDNDDTIQSEIQKLEQDMEADDTQPKKGLFSMKFMQDAEKRNMNATRAMLDDFKNEWLDEEEGKEENSAEAHIIQNNPGRLNFGGPTAASGGKMSAATGASKKVALNDAGQIKKVSHSAAHTTRTSGMVDIAPRSALDSELAETHEEGVSPWLQQVESRVKGKKASKKNNTSKGKIEDKAELNIAKIKKAQKQEGEDVQLDLDATLPALGKKASNSKAQKTKDNKSDSVAPKEPSAAGTRVTTTPNGAVMDSDSEGEDDDAVGMVHASGKLAFAQRELVARAFANDNVTREFEEEKDAVVEDDAEKTEDLTLPGWGDWAGKGVKKKKNKVVRKIQGIDPSKRKDAQLKHVIINEKRIKKTEKYQVTAVPYPYKTMEQYERAMRTPVGKEWNTRNTFQKMTKPKVLTKLGTVIDPLHAPFQ